MMRRVVAVALIAAGLSAGLTTGCVPAPPRSTPPPPLPPPAMAVAAAPVSPTFVLEGVAIQGGLLRGTAPAGSVRVVLERPGASPVDAARSGDRFMVGFDRDAAPAATLVATLRDGRTVRLPLIVAPRAWAIERVDAPLRAGRTSAEFAALRPDELTRIAAARADAVVPVSGPAAGPVSGQPTGWRDAFVVPARGRFSGRFGAQRLYRGGVRGSFHGGLDIAVAIGTPVIAPAAGIVRLAADPARPFTLEGNLLIVDHGGGLNSAFLHLSRIDVTVGQRVAAGQVIGASGATGRVSGPHLHWSLMWRDARIDPEPLVGVLP